MSGNFPWSGPGLPNYYTGPSCSHFLSYISGAENGEKRSYKSQLRLAAAGRRAAPFPNKSAIFEKGHLNLIKAGTGYQSPVL